MASTVNSAFKKFIKDTVNLDKNKTNLACTSRDNLINNIKEFSGSLGFFYIYDDKILKFGSFERGTKIRPIDDIDIMICISGEGKRTYTEMGSVIYINGCNDDLSNALMTNGTKYLNSTKVINRFISKLSELNDYRHAEIHKNHEAATLKLKSYTWNFDIVPCFYTDCNYYLIPDGAGNWKKTNPRIDNERTVYTNKQHNGKLLELIRLVKYWNNRRVTLKIGTYLLECMILNIYEKNNSTDKWWIDIEFYKTLKCLASDILNDVNDPKDIQGNLNYFCWEQRCKIRDDLLKVCKKIEEAIDIEMKDQKDSINKWREILGDDFPKFTDV